MNKVMYKKPVAETIQFENDDVITIISGFEFLERCEKGLPGTDTESSFIQANNDTRVGIRCLLTTNGNDVITGDQGWKITTWGAYKEMCPALVVGKYW